MTRIIRKLFLSVLVMCCAVSCSLFEPDNKTTYSFMGTWHGTDMNSIVFYITGGSIEGEDGKSVSAAGKKIKPLNISEFHKNVVDGQRGLIYVVDDGSVSWKGDVVNIKVDHAENVLTKGIYKTERLDTLGKEGLDINYANMAVDLINKNTYIDIQCAFYTIVGLNHGIWLADDITKDTPFDSEGYSHLYLKHRLTTVNMTGSQYMYGVVSFIIAPEYIGEKGIKVHYRSLTTEKDMEFVLKTAE